MQHNIHNIYTTQYTHYIYNTTYTTQHDIHIKITTQHTYHKYNKNQVPRVSQCAKCDWTVLTKVLKGRLANWDGREFHHWVTLKWKNLC